MRAALHALLVAVLLTSAGCAGVFGPDRPPSDERALDAVNRSGAALADVESYRFTIDGQAEASKGDEEVSATIEGAGAVDVGGQRMAVTTETEGSNQFGRDERRTYLDGTTLYRECRLAGWGRENLSADEQWIAHTPAGRQLALLNATDVYWRGTGELDGEEVAVLAAYPTKEELQAADTRTTDSTDLEDANVRNVTVTLWLDAETHLPVQSRTEIEVRADGATATFDVTTQFEDYGAAVNVTEPDIQPDDIRKLGC